MSGTSGIRCRLRAASFGVVALAVVFGATGCGSDDEQGSSLTNVSEAAAIRADEARQAIDAQAADALAIQVAERARADAAAAEAARVQAEAEAQAAAAKAAADQAAADAAAAERAAAENASRPGPGRATSGSRGSTYSTYTETTTSGPAPAPEQPYVPEQYTPGPPIVIQMPPIVGPQQPGGAPTFTFNG